MSEVRVEWVCRGCGCLIQNAHDPGCRFAPASVQSCEQAWEMAQAEWLRDPTPEREKALNEAADALRWKRQGGYEAEGVTDALLRERFNEDELEDDA